MLNVVNPYTGNFNLKRNKPVPYEKPSSKSQYKKKRGKNKWWRGRREKRELIYGAAGK